MERRSRDDHVLLNCCDTKTDGTGRIAARPIRVDVDATVLASFLIKAWEGAVLRAKVEKNGTPSKNSKQRVREIAYLAPQPSEK